MESGLTQKGFVRSGLTQSGITESGLTQSGTMKSGLTESGSPESGIILAESGLTRSGTTESGLTQLGITESGLTQPGPTLSGLFSLVVLGPRRIKCFGGNQNDPYGNMLILRDLGGNKSALLVCEYLKVIQCNELALKSVI